MNTISIIIAGVADQPIYSTALQLAEKVHARGWDVAVSGSPEARAGKDVNAVVRWSEGALSPLVMKGTCRVVIGLEALEGLRQAAAQYAPGLTLFLSSREIPPTSVLHKGKDYPNVAQAVAQLEAAGVKVVLADAHAKSDEEVAAALAEMALVEVS